MIADYVPPHAPVRTSYATSYCLSGTMANGKSVHPHAIAHNGLRLGTRIRLTHPAFGMRNFIVSDTGPALRDGHFDIWTGSCAMAVKWGRRTIHYRIVHR